MGRWRKDKTKEAPAPSSPSPPAPAPGTSAPAWLGAREASEQMLQELWTFPATEPKVPARQRRPGPKVAPRLKPSQAYFPVMSDEELAPLLVPAKAGPQQIRDTFQQYGVCVVTDVIGDEECALLEKLWLQDILQLLDESKADPQVAARIAALKEHGPKAWPQEWDEYFGFKGMASRRGLPHGSFAWGARLHPKVRQVFADLFDTPTEELAVGLDNVFWASAMEGAAGANQEWLHVDQNHRTGLTWPCAQGVLYVWPSEGSCCSSTVVWPGSHRAAYDQLMEDPQAYALGRSLGGQSVRLKQLADPGIREELLSQALLNSRRIPCPAGSVLLWDSRLIHQGWKGGPRLAQPICWEPKERRREDALRRKLWMCCTGTPSSHSSSEGRVHGMAKEAPSVSAWAEGWPSLRASLVPYGVKPGQEAAWLNAQPELWRNSNPKRQADRGEVSQMLQLLREEVVQAL